MSRSRLFAAIVVLAAATSFATACADSTGPSSSRAVAHDTVRCETQGSDGRIICK